MKGTFSSLDPKSEIFEEIKIQKPPWWRLFCGDNELYIDIRKDNYISVYHYGGLVAEINYKKNDFAAEINQKYLVDNISRSKYVPLDLTKMNENTLAIIKYRIRSVYLRQKNREKPAEDWLKGKIRNKSSKYIDSELQFNQDPEIGKLRIDLIKLSDGKLMFVELKGIFDSRLRVDESRNPNPPKIIEQMEKYQMFINKYETDITNYYIKLIELKNYLGLTTFDDTNFLFDNKPKLLIVDTYKKMTKGREERIKAIKRVLENNNIDYEITKWKS